MATRDLTVSVEIDAPVEAVWRAVTDWQSQGRWMLATEVRILRGDGASLGSEVAATTGVGPLAVTDPMEIVGWDPPHRATVRHLGRIVRGSGTFTVRERGAGSVFCWSEQVELPFGVLGALGWPVARPVVRAGLGFSLARLARQSAARHRSDSA